MFLAPPLRFRLVAALAILALSTTTPASLAQTIVLSESFPNNSQFTTQDGNGALISFFSDGDSSYLGLHNGVAGDFGGDPQPTGIGTYHSFKNNLLVVENAGGTVSPLPISLVWSDLDITGLREVTVLLGLASLNESTFEADDFLRLEFSVDGGPFFTILETRASQKGLMAEDTNLDGVGDSGALNEEVAFSGRALIVEGTSLDVRLSISIDDVAEDLAVDQIAIFGDPINDWTSDSDGSPVYFSASNWSLLSVPNSSEDALIRNGSTAIAISAESGDPSSGEVRSLLLGDHSGGGGLSFTGVDFSANILGVGGQDALQSLRSGTFSGAHGTFTYRNTSSLDISQNMNIGNVRTFGSTSVQSSGEALVENVTTATIQTMDVGGGWPRDSSTANSEGSATFRNLETLTFQDDIDFCDADPIGSVGELATSICMADGLFEDVTTLEVMSDIEISDGVATANESLTQSATVELTDIDMLTVADDFEIVSNSSLDTGPTAGVNQATGLARLTRTTAVINDNLDIGDYELSTDAVLDASATLELIFSTWTSLSGSVGVVGKLTGGFDTGETILEALLRLDSSDMTHNGSLEVGFATNAPADALEAELELDNGSTLTVEQLDVGSEGTLEIRLDGLINPFGSFNAGLGSTQELQEGWDALESLGGFTYSAVMATDATLDGEVVVVFDFLPPPGFFTFDLITTGSAGALADTTATLILLGLDAGFTVSSFGVVTDTVDVLRLEISGAPEPIDLTAEITNGVDSLVSGQPVTYTGTISNRGPADEPAAEVVVDFPIGLESCSWTSQDTGDATSSGSGSGIQLDEEVNMPAGSQVIFTITCDLVAEATGELTTEIEVFSSRTDSSPGNDTASDTDTILDVADLSIALSDGESTALPGDLRFYTIVVANAGPRTVTDAVVTDVFPPELIGCTWTCVADNPGAGCTSPMGDGNISQTVILAASGQITFTAGCQVDPELDPATLTITNSASITPPSGIMDLNSANNIAQDVNGGPGAVLFRDGFESGDLTDWASIVPTP